MNQEPTGVCCESVTIPVSRHVMNQEDHLLLHHKTIFSAVVPRSLGHDCCFAFYVTTDYNSNTSLYAAFIMRSSHATISTELSLFFFASILVMTINNVSAGFGLVGTSQPTHGSPDPTNTVISKEDAFCKWMSLESLEEISDRPLEVMGTIPNYVHGSYVKNGPAAFSTTDRKYTHIFDGLAKLLKFDIQQGTNVRFTCKFVDSKWKRAMLEKDYIPPSLTTGTTDPPFSFRQVLYAAITSAVLFDNTPVNVEYIASRYMTTTDAPVMNEFDLKTLTTKGRWRLPKIKNMPGFPLFSTAHGKRDPNNASINYNYFLEVGFNGIHAHMVRTDGNGTRTSIGKISTAGKIPYVHDISVTDHYAILCLYPLTVDPFTLLSGKGFMETLVFDSTRPTIIHVFALDGTTFGPIASFETPAFFAYHHVNAYEDSTNHTTIVLDILAYETASMINGPHAFLYMANMMTEQGRNHQERDATVWRWTLELMTQPIGGRITPEKLEMMDQDTGLRYGMELATVSPLVQGKPYRYCYGFTGFYRGQPGYLDWSIVKKDIHDTCQNKIWFEERCYPGESIFVPDPSGQAEDDGVLLNAVYDSKRGETFLLILNATTMKELGRAYSGIAMYVSMIKCIQEHMKIYSSAFFHLGAVSFH